MQTWHTCLFMLWYSSLLYHHHGSHITVNMCGIRPSSIQRHIANIHVLVRASYPEMHELLPIFMYLWAMCRRPFRQERTSSQNNDEEVKMIEPNCAPNDCRSYLPGHGCGVGTS